MAGMIRQIGISDAEVLSMEEAIRWNAVGSSAQSQAIA
ncbi:unnamed protein product [Mycetohabitans rhizoxinica HKI 454]|uniref:Uncharacterized protein n=1 Tax=Mycetohabitans rhizoxinica (strain DSM 19002 / CIP 109453 / HKI 454) TaxID=882378 RepID=E5ARR5_MYCRK|nr:unnamed protein product [Mycetohabitans rhizoxinica HKI 454]